MRKLDFIDAIRGVAVLMVLLTHSAQIVKSTGVVSSIAIACAKGVELFFVASAFTLSLSWFARSANEATPTINFYIRRFFRIAPLFYFGIVLYLIIRGTVSHYWAPDGVSVLSVIASFTFLNGLHPAFINAVVPGGWSIAVEMMFYLFFPFIIMQLTNLRRATIFLFFSCVVSGVFIFLLRRFGLFYSTPQYLVHNFEYYNLITQLPVFACGFIAYYAFQSKKLSTLFVSSTCMIFGGALVLSHFSPAGSILIKSPPMIGMLFSCFILLLAWFPTRVFINPFFIFLGKISFSMYLLQFAVFDFFERLEVQTYLSGSIGAMLFFLVALIITACLAYASFIYIEKPGMKIGKLVISLHSDFHSKKNANQVS